MDQDQVEQVYVTRELLLNGRRYVEEVSTTLGIFKIRPLTEGEKAKIEALSVKGVKAQGRREQMANMELTLDMEVMIANEWEVKMSILAAGLSVEPKSTFTLSDVKNMTLDPGIRDKLVAEIRRISGLPSAADVLRRFRDQSSGAAAGGANPSGVPASTND